MHQLKQDVDTIMSNTLSSGTAVSFNSNGSLAQQISSLMLSQVANTNDTQLPVELHIPLSDIFGLCKNTHFDMSMTDGLIIQVECEPLKRLFQTRSVGIRVPMPPLIDASGNGFAAQPEVSPFTFLPKGQNDTGMPSYKYATTEQDASGNALVQPPNGFHYANNIHQFFDPTNPATTSTSAITLAGSWSAQQLLDAKFIPGNIIKLNFRWADPAEKFRSKMIEMLDIITAVTASVTPGTTTNDALITLGGAYRAPYGVFSIELTQVALESFDVYQCPVSLAVQADATQALQAIQIGVATSDTSETYYTSIDQFFTENKVAVPPVLFQGLIDSGLVCVAESADGQLSWTGTGPFRICAQPVNTGEGGYQTPWIDQFEYADSTTARQIWTAQAKPLAVQGTECQILSCSAEDASGNRILTFKDFGFANHNSLQNGVLIKDTLGTKATEFRDPGVVFYIYLMRSRAKGTLTGLQKDLSYSYQIDKAEITLVEMTLDPSIPQTMLYETKRVEVATIETSVLDIYNRQFVVNEPSVSNCWLLTPQYTASERLGTPAGTDPSGNHFYSYHPESLVSYARGVQQYKWSINNIQDTNRYVEVATNVSKYPSSLHLEKLMDTFSNTTDKMTTFSGIMTVPRTASDPVVCFPLRVYEAMDEQNTYLREGGFTVQVELLGDSVHDSNIVSGPIFFYKTMLKSLK
jgi:hypothetical protein